MSLLRKCPIEGCHYNKQPVHADKSQIKNHILRDHDYQEKLKAASNLGLIHNISEHRSPVWLAEGLVDFSVIRS